MTVMCYKHHAPVRLCKCLQPYYGPRSATRPTATAPVEAGEVTQEALVEQIARVLCRLCCGLDPDTPLRERHDGKKLVWQLYTDEAAALLPFITVAEQRGAESERRKVVAWMKGPCVPDHSDEGGCPFDKAANAIETGAHDG